MATWASAPGFKILHECLTILLADMCEGHVLLQMRKVHQTRTRRIWPIRSTWVLSFLPFFSLLIWRGGATKRWLRKPCPGKHPNLPGNKQVNKLRCKGRHVGFPIGKKHLSTSSEGTAENRAVRIFFEKSSHTLFFFFFWHESVLLY